MFHQKCQRTQNKKIESRQGASLVIVVCVAAFLVAFALAMVYTAGLMLSQANKRLNQERCYQLARSFAQTLDAELKKYEDIELDETTKNAYADSFFLFSCKFLEKDGYLVYKPNHPESVYHYKIDGENLAEKDYGTIDVALYKESDTVGDKIEGELTYNNSNPDLDPLGTAAGKVNRYTFTVEVTASLNGVSYSYRTVYSPATSYNEGAVDFWNSSGKELKWDESEKKWRGITGSEYNPADNEKIKYEIKPDFDYLKGCRFIKITPEKGELIQTGGEEAENP